MGLEEQKQHNSVPSLEILVLSEQLESNESSLLQQHSKREDADVTWQHDGTMMPSCSLKAELSIAQLQDMPQL